MKKVSQGEETLNSTASERVVTINNTTIAHSNSNWAEEFIQEQNLDLDWASDFTSGNPVSQVTDVAEQWTKEFTSISFPQSFKR